MAWRGMVQVLGLEVGKVDTSNFFSWLRVKLAKCEHRSWDSGTLGLVDDGFGGNYLNVAELFRLVNVGE